MTTTSEKLKNTYPFIVTMNDETLSLSDIETYFSEAKRMKSKMDMLRILNAVAGFGVVLSILVIIFAAIGVGFSNDDDRIEIISKFAIALFILFFLIVIRLTISNSMTTIESIQINELKLIDSDPGSCEKLVNWIEEYDDIKRYVETISVKGRLPTFAEFHCMERWVTKKQNDGPVENLRHILNVN